MLFKQKLGQSNVTSLVERVSRFTVILKNPNKRTKPVMAKIMSAIKDLPSSPVGPSLLTAEPSLSVGNTCKPRSEPRRGSATPPAPGRKAQSRTLTDAFEGGCPANAISGNAQITI